MSKMKELQIQLEEFKHKTIWARFRSHAGLAARIRGTLTKYDDWYAIGTGAEALIDFQIEHIKAIDPAGVDGWPTIYLEDPQEESND